MCFLLPQLLLLVPYLVCLFALVPQRNSINLSFNLAVQRNLLSTLCHALSIFHSFSKSPVTNEHQTSEKKNLTNLTWALLCRNNKLSEREGERVYDSSSWFFYVTDCCLWEFIALFRRWFDLLSYAWEGEKKVRIQFDSHPPSTQKSCHVWQML